MNILLWTLQILLALHTVIGAGWKLMNSEAVVRSLPTIPHGVWLSFATVEVLCAVGLVIPMTRPQLGALVPMAGAVIAVEMLGFSWLSLRSGTGQTSELVYFLLVAGVCAVIVARRLLIAPIRPVVSGS